MYTGRENADQSQPQKGKESIEDAQGNCIKMYLFPAQSLVEKYTDVCLEGESLISCLNP